MIDPGILLIWLIAFGTLLNFALLITVLFFLIDLSTELFESRHEVGRLAESIF